MSMQHHQVQTILLVEDEQQQRELLAAILEGEGYKVLSAESAELAHERLRLSSPDLIVTDVKLPGADGFAFFDTVRQSEPTRRTPFIFITGYNEPEAIQRVKTLGAAAYITKPYDLGQLMDLIRDVVNPGQVNQ